MLPGFIAGGALSPITQVDSARAYNSGGAVSVTLPATIQAGDLLVLQTYGSGVSSGAVTFSAISGWTTVTNVGAGTIHRASLHCKIATSLDAGASVSGGVVGDNSCYKAVLVFRGGYAMTGLTVGSAAGEFNSGNPSAQTVTLSGATEPLVVVGAYGTNDTGALVDPRTFTISGVGAKDGELQQASTSDHDYWIAWKIFNTGGIGLATPVVVDMDDDGFANTLMSCYIACT